MPVTHALSCMATKYMKRIRQHTFVCICGCMAAMQPCEPGTSALQLRLHSVCWPWLSHAGQIDPIACTYRCNCCAKEPPMACTESLVWYMKTRHSCICLPGRSALPHRECCNSQYQPQLAVPCYCSAVHFHSACICRSHKDSNHPPSSFRHSLQKMTYSMLHAELPSAICLSSSLGLCCPRNAYLRSSTRLKHHDKLYASNSDNPPHCLQILHSQPSWLHKQPQQQQSLPNSLTEWGSQKPLTSCNRPLAFAQFICLQESCSSAEGHWTLIYVICHPRREQQLPLDAMLISCLIREHGAPPKCCRMATRNTPQ